MNNILQTIQTRTSYHEFRDDILCDKGFKGLLAIIILIISYLKF